MAKTIPRSYVFVLARQRRPYTAPSYLPYQRNSIESDDDDIEYRPPIFDMIEIKKEFIKTFNLENEDVHLRWRSLLNRKYCLIVTGNSSELDLPEEFDGLPIFKKE